MYPCYLDDDDVRDARVYGINRSEIARYAIRTAVRRARRGIINLDTQEVAG
jgi:post-segregation antitoxin (ccd killing protein)